MPNTESGNGLAITELFFSNDSKIQEIATKNKNILDGSKPEEVPKDAYVTIQNPNNDGINYIWCSGGKNGKKWKMTASKNDKEIVFFKLDPSCDDKTFKTAMVKYSQNKKDIIGIYGPNK